MNQRLKTLIKKITLTLSALVLVACGQSAATDSSTLQTDTATFPVTITNNGKYVVIAKQPTAIISLSPTATEMLFAIGAGAQVIAVDNQSTFPADAPISELSGFTPNIEAIVAAKPDLVVVSNDIDNVITALSTANIPVLLETAAENLDDTYEQITELGIATGQIQGAADLVQSMKTDIEASLATLKKPEVTLTFYHELDPTFYSVTSATFIGQLYKLAGLENIADKAPDASSGYPQLSAEYIVKSNPNLIFLADTKCCAVNAADLAKRPGFNSLGAVNNSAVVELDDDIASRWGPRTTDLFASIVAAVNELATS